MRTETAELCLTAARSILAEVAAGRSVDPLRVKWAEQMLAGNSPEQQVGNAPATSRARAEPA